MRRSKWPSWTAGARAPHMRAETTTICRRCTRRASGSPMTRCFANQLALALVRSTPQRVAGRAQGRRRSARQGPGRPALRADRRSQRSALAEIAADMAQPDHMMRLLQGDVGSGKTVVALLAMLIAVESRRPGRIHGADRNSRAPASRDLAPLAQAGRRQVALLTGREKGRARAAILRPRRRARSRSSSARMRCCRRTSSSAISASPSSTSSTVSGSSSAWRSPKGPRRRIRW